MSTLEKKINYQFKDFFLLQTALTHSSFANENRRSGLFSNERCEFLGDSILGMLVARYLYMKKPEMAEGDMTRLRAELVCESSLVGVADEWELGQHLRLGKGEISNGGRTRPSILADAVEAVIAAVYLDGGIYAASELVNTFILTPFENKAVQLKIDYKTELQEQIQKNKQSVSYVLIGEEGPDHNKIFYVEVMVEGEKKGKGTGKSKKEAEQDAARMALEVLGI